MKLIKILTLLFVVFASASADAQILKKLGKKAEKAAERAVERRVERETEKSTDRALDSIIDAPKKTKKKKKKKSKKTDESSNEESDSGNISFEEDYGSLEEEGANEVGFKPGNRVIFEDNFSKDALGDFPAKWTSTKGGEVKKLKGFENKYLKVPGGSVVSMELTKSLPENFTVEFDLILPAQHPYRRPAIGFGPEPKKIDYMIATRNSLTFDIMSTEVGNGYYGIYYAEKSLATGKEEVRYKAPLNKKIHMAFEVNGKRIRMFVDGDKKVDLPSIFKDQFRKSIFFNSITSGWEETKDAYFFMSNVRIAETGEDERSKVYKALMEEGGLSTNAILFNSGSSTIKDPSNPIIKDVADALKSASDMKIVIIGHTDTDGEADTNLRLSRDRADAVKAVLVKTYGIKSSRVFTDGEGEELPVADNSTEAGKAKNRRVEFKKL